MVRRKKVISENACGRTIFRENSKKNIFFAKRACKNEINVVLYLSRRKTGTEYGSVVQLVRTLACHARGHGFESRPSRHICGFSSFGRAPPCQGGGSGFEPRNPLQESGSFLRSGFFTITVSGVCYGNLK